MSEVDYQSSVDLEDWWSDLTIEQRRAAFEAWQKADVKAVFADLNTTHSQVGQFSPFKSDKEKELDAIHEHLASKVVWDQDRFKDKDLPMSDSEFKAYLREQSLKNPSTRFA